VRVAEKRNTPAASICALTTRLQDHDDAWIFREPAPAASLVPTARTAEVVRALKATARTLNEDAAFDANPIGIDPDSLSGHWATIQGEADWFSPLLGFEP
jgi:hypothetical protein